MGPARFRCAKLLIGAEAVSPPAPLSRQILHLHGSDEQQKQLQNVWVTTMHYIAYLNTHRGVNMSLSVGSSSNNLGDGPDEPLIPRAGWMHQPIPPHVDPVVYTATQRPPGTGATRFLRRDERLSIMDNGSTVHCHNHRADFSTFRPLTSRKAFAGGGEPHTMVGQGIVFRQTTQSNGEVRTWGLETMYIPTLPSLVNGTAMQQSAEWVSYGDETGTLWTRRADGTAFKSIYRAGQEVIPGTIGVKQLASSSPGPAPLRYADCVHSVDHRPVTKDFAATTDKLTIEQIRGLLLGNPSGINRNEREYLRVQLANVGVLTTGGERDQFMKALEALGFPSIRLAIATAAKYGIPLGRYATIVKRSVPHMLANAHRIEPKRPDRTIPKQCQLRSHTLASTRSATSRHRVSEVTRRHSSSWTTARAQGTSSACETLPSHRLDAQQASSSRTPSTTLSKPRWPVPSSHGGQT